jgi:hypothetical protein
VASRRSSASISASPARPVAASLRAGQRVAERSDCPGQRPDRPLVEADDRVIEVAVVEQDEVGPRDARQLRHLGPRARDVDCHLVHARQRTADARIQADGEVVRAQHGLLGRR